MAPIRSSVCAAAPTWMMTNADSAAMKFFSIFIGFDGCLVLARKIRQENVKNEKKKNVTSDFFCFLSRNIVKFVNSLK